MTTEIKCVHCEIDDTVRQKLESKLKRLDYAEELIVNLDFTITLEKQYRLETNVHFRWGQIHHIKVETFDIIKGIELLVDKLEQKVTKEKEKVQHH